MTWHEPEVVLPMNYHTVLIHLEREGKPQSDTGVGEYTPGGWFCLKHGQLVHLRDGERVISWAELPPPLGP